MTANKALGLTRPTLVNGLYSGNSNVYFHPDAFSTSRSLFYAIGHEFVHVSQNICLTGLPYELYSGPAFVDMLEYGAYSYQNSLGGSKYSSWTKEVIKGYYNEYGDLFLRLTNYNNFDWTHNVKYIYPL